MKFASLEAFGLHDDLIAAWRRDLGEDMLAVQEKAVAAGLLAGANVLAVAPAGSGKTAVAEMALAAALGRRGQAWYLVPTRALAEQKHAELSRRFAAAAPRLCIATRDHTESDAALAQGEFDLAVAVPEKARALMAHNPALLRQAGVVVVDELELLADAERGPSLEMLLADTLSLGSAQVVALAASAANAAELAAWLRARLVEDRLRPVELRLGVVTAARFRYREHNTGSRGEEDLAYEPIGEGAAGHLAGLALALARRGEQTLVFVRDRATANALAVRLAEMSVLPAAGGLGDRLAHCAPTAGVRMLRELAAAGVGLHHSDLQAPERLAVEEALADGELLALVATSTLAAGVNLPARNVVIDPVQWQPPARPDGRAALRPLPLAELRAMAGRAGRLGHGDACGRAILVAETPAQRDALLRAYVEADAAAIEPALPRLRPEDALVTVGLSALAADVGLAGAWQATFSARRAGAEPAWREALADLARSGLLDEAGRPTALLRASAGGSAGAASLLWLKRFSDADPGAGDWLDLLAIACAAPYMARLPFPLSRAELRGADYVRELMRRAAEAGLGGAVLAATFHSPSLSPTGRQRAAKLTLALLRWASGEAAADVEAAVRLPAARLEALAGSAAWLMEVGAGMAAASGWAPNDVQRLRDAARALRLGLPPGAADESDAEPAWLGSAPERRQTPRRPGPPTAAAPGAEAPPATAEAESGASPAAIELDEDRPDRAVVGGGEVRLTLTEFRLLWRVAEQPGALVRYLPLIAALFGAEEYEGAHQVYPHVSRLRRKLRGAAGPEAEGWIVTLRGVGVRLALEPRQVRLRRSAACQAV